MPWVNLHFVDGKAELWVIPALNYNQRHVRRLPGVISPSLVRTRPGRVDFYSVADPRNKSRSSRGLVVPL